jgi:CRP/FNR family transcriptional regulator
MPEPALIDKWMNLFPALGNLNPEHLGTAREAVRFVELASGAVAYHQGWECPNYVMCVEGTTRVFKSSDLGREILIYRLSAGETCVLTTSCLLAGGTFPAESVAETPGRLACIPAKTFHHLMTASPPFRRFVLDDYARLLNSMISLIDEVTFDSLDERLARRLLAEADAQGTVRKTHQQLALDLGSVREVVSRYLGEWERAGWIRTTRGKIEILSKADLATYRGRTSTSGALT